MSRLVIGLSGNLERPSKTRTLVLAAVAQAAARFDAEGEVLDLSDFQPSLGSARRVGELDDTARAQLERLVSADALILASPVYKGSYTGLFKHLFDLIDPAALRDKPVLLAATGGGEKHALVVEHQLRPLLAFFEAQVLPTAVYASERDFVDGKPASAALLDRLSRAVGQFGPLILRPRSAVAA